MKIVAWQRQDLLADLVLPLLVTFVESSWIALWIGLISEAPAFAARRPLLHGPTVFGILLVVGFATRAVLNTGWTLWRVRTAILLVAALAGLLGLATEYAGFHRAPASGGISSLLVTLLIAAALDWRGVRLGRSEMRFDDVYIKFRLGLFAFLVLLAALSLSGYMARFVDGAVPAALIFLSAGLVSLSLSRIGEVQKDSRLQRGEPLRLDGRWLAVLLGLVGAILLVTLLLSSLISLAALRSLLMPVGEFLGWASNGFIYLFYPIGYLAAFLIYVMRFLLSLLHAAQPPQPPQPADTTQLLRNLKEGNGPHLPPDAALVLKTVALTVVVFIVLSVLARSVFRYWRREDQEGAVELRESVFDAGEFWASLRAILRRLLGRWRRGRVEAAVPESAGDQLVAATPAARTVRQIYRRLLVRMTQYGTPRGRMQTPYDYLSRLEQSLGDGYEDAVIITEAYVRVRYGDRPVSDAELDVVQGSWATLDQRLAGTGDGRSGEHMDNLS